MVVTRLIRQRHCIAILAAFLFSTSYTAVSDQLNTLTGSLRTRIVWLEGGDKLYGGGAVKGYDSQTGLTTTILAAAFQQNRPIICTGGNKVVVSIDYKVYIVNWDGTNKRYLVDGFCSDVWIEPSTSEEWIVVRRGAATTAAPIYRYKISDPTVSFALFDNGRACGTEYGNWYQISADGTVAADFLPWPNCVLVTNGGLVNAGAGTLLGYGCWSSVASDNSYYTLFFNNSGDAGHNAFEIYKNKDSVAVVPITAGPLPSGTLTEEFYHPRFASKGGRFVTLTGGYYEDRWGGGDDDAEVYFGKFNTTYRGFDGWVRVTTTAASEYWPDAWVGVESMVPAIRIGQDTLRFSAAQGGAGPAAQNVNVTTPYGTLTNVTAVSGQSWLTVVVGGSGASWSVSNTVNTAGLAAGAHYATVTVSASNTTPSSQTYVVAVAITGSSVATTVQLSPQVCQVPQGATAQFSATVLDQSGAVMNPQPAVAWTTSGTADGNSVTAAGLFTAGTTVGQFAVTAQSGTAAATAQVQVVAAGAPVTLISPVGGESFRVGDVMTVRWTAVNNINAIVVQVRPNDASGWYKIVQSYVLRTDGNWGAYQWTVTPTIGDNVPLVSSQARVRVYNYWVETEEAISPAVFSIVPSDRIVMAPLTGGAGGVSLRQTGHGFTVVLPDAMQYRLELFSPLGARYQTMHRAGPAQVDIDRVPLGAGSLIMRLMTGDEVICRQVLQFE